LYIGDYFDIEAVIKNENLSTVSFELFKQRNDGLSVSVAFIRERKREQCTSTDEPVRHKHYDKVMLSWLESFRIYCL